MNIYDKLESIIEVKKYRLSIAPFSEENKRELDNKDVPLFDLLKNISSLAVKISNKIVEFCPYLIAEGSRTFAIEDLSDNDYDLLLSLDLKRLPLNLQARIADILWTQKKHYDSAVIATEAYYNLFVLWFKDDDWLEPLKMMKRAICISTQINKNDLCDRCYQTIYDHIKRIDGNDTDFLSISLIEVLLFHSYKDLEKTLVIIDNIIKNSHGNLPKTEQAYALKAKCLIELKRKDLAIQTNIDMADYFINFGEELLKNDVQGPLRAQYFFQKAIQTYRNNGQSQKAEQAHKRLVEVQKEIPKLMKPITKQLDIHAVIENINQNMAGLSFEESILRLSQMVYFYKKEDFKKKVLEDLQLFPFSHMFTNAVVNENGQTTFTLQGLDLFNPEKDIELLDAHIHQKMLEYQSLFGDIYARNILYYLKSNFDMEKIDLDFLLLNNALVPEDRADIFRSAILMAFKGEYYEAIHILAPQTENMFRMLAKELGGLTVTLETDGTSKEKVLTSIFDLPELIDSYDNDILFLFKGLLNEQAGANIRNEIAHGIMNPYRANSGASLYFICAIIKLLFISSRRRIELTNTIGKELPPPIPLKKSDMIIHD